MSIFNNSISNYGRGAQRTGGTGRTGQTQKAGSSKYTSAKLKKDLEQAAQTAYNKWQFELKKLKRMKIQMEADYNAHKSNPNDNNLKIIYQTRKQQCSDQESLCNELRDKWHNAMNACIDASK